MNKLFRITGFLGVVSVVLVNVSCTSLRQPKTNVSQKTTVTQKKVAPIKQTDSLSTSVLPVSLPVKSQGTTDTASALVNKTHVAIIPSLSMSG